MQAVKNLLLDFGGVFIDVDYHRTEQAFIDAGVTDFNSLYSQQAASPLFEDLEKGLVNEMDFFKRLRNISGTSLNDSQITTCWNSILGSYYPQAIDWVKRIRKKYRVFLFSNTNSIHHKRFMEIYQAQLGKADFNALFETAYYSHLIGKRKPYPEAYTWVLADAGLNAWETLFIDDTKVNIEGAVAAGLQVLHLASPMKVWDLEL
jgi:putative hydrolase of the HAD superfamily